MTLLNLDRCQNPVCPEMWPQHQELTLQNKNQFLSFWIVQCLNTIDSPILSKKVVTKSKKNEHETSIEVDPPKVPEKDNKENDK